MLYFSISIPGRSAGREDDHEAGNRSPHAAGRRRAARPVSPVPAALRPAPALPDPFVHRLLLCGLRHAADDRLPAPGGFPRRVPPEPADVFFCCPWRASMPLRRRSVTWGKSVRSGRAGLSSPSCLFCCSSPSFSPCCATSPPSPSSPPFPRFPDLSPVGTEPPVMARTVPCAPDADPHRKSQLRRPETRPGASTRKELS